MYVPTIPLAVLLWFTCVFAACCPLPNRSLVSRDLDTYSKCRNVRSRDDDITACPEMSRPFHFLIPIILYSWSLMFGCLTSIQDRSVKLHRRFASRSSLSMFFSLYCRHLSTASWWLLVVLCVRAYDRSRLSMTTPYQPRYPTHRGRVSHFDQLAWPNNFLWMLPGRFTCLRGATDHQLSSTELQKQVHIK